MTREIMMAVETDAPVYMNVAGDEPIAMRTAEYVSGGGGTTDYEALTNRQLTVLNLSGTKPQKNFSLKRLSLP